MKILIAGGGIGGLTTALSLHSAGMHDVQVLEAATQIRQLGVGVNLPPHAIRELTELGLGPALAKIGVPTSELSYYDRQGKLIWAEPRGLIAGYLWPQYSIHRGRLQQLLYDTVKERLGEHAVRVGQRVTGFQEELNSANPSLAIVAKVTNRSGAHYEQGCDLLIAADGIRSSLRECADPTLGKLATNGWMMYRGTTRCASFLSGTSMVIIGDEHLRVVVYPIEPGVNNWLLVRPHQAKGVGDDNTSININELGHWSREVNAIDVAKTVSDWRFDWLDVPAMIAASDLAWEYPMADFDPLPRWTFGRMVLLGDAAHAMYPFGSNGASQAILDARVLAYQLYRHGGLSEALVAFEAERLPVASAVQLANRRQAGDVMAKISALVRQDAHASAKAELQEVEDKYKQLAGFDAQTLNARASWSVTEVERKL